MRIKPVSDYVLYRHMEPDQVGKIAIPAAYRGQRSRAQVLAIGPDVTCCAPDDFVVLSPGGEYMEADPNDSDLHLVSAEHVVAVVEYEAADDVPKGLIVNVAGGLS